MDKGIGFKSRTVTAAVSVERVPDMACNNAMFDESLSLGN